MPHNPHTSPSLVEITAAISCLDKRTLENQILEGLVLEKLMAIACTLRYHSMETAFSYGVVEEAEPYSASPRRAQSSHFSFDDPTANGTAVFSSKKCKTERCPIMKELEAAACREDTLFARHSRMEAAVRVSKGSDPEAGRRRRQPNYAGDLREAAKQLAIATMNCENLMQRVTVTSC